MGMDTDYLVVGAGASGLATGEDAPICPIKRQGRTHVACNGEIVRRGSKLGAMRDVTELVAA
jgi:hypothetical protein